MNSLGNAGGALSAFAVTRAVTWFGWNSPFLLTSALCVIAALLYLRIDATKRIVWRPRPAAASAQPRHRARAGRRARRRTEDWGDGPKRHRESGQREQDQAGDRRPCSVPSAQQGTCADHDPGAEPERPALVCSGGQERVERDRCGQRPA